jgi:hypothetical protein
MTYGTRRRGSIFTGLLLIILGLLFLIDRFDPSFALGHLIRLYWPVLIILWGVAKLIDHLAANRAGEPHAPFLSGGEAALLIVLAFVLTAFAFRDWLHEHHPDLLIGFPAFHESYKQNHEIAARAIPSGAHVIVETEHGDISIHPADDDNLRVNVSESARASSRAEAEDAMRRTVVSVQQEGNAYHIRPAAAAGSEADVNTDLDITIPKDVSLQAATDHGDIEISGIKGDVTVHTGKGDVDIHDIAANVAADIQAGDAKIENVGGNLKLTGRGKDLDVSNIGGDADIDGAFEGSIHASSVTKTAHCVSPWFDLSITHLTGSLEADSDDVQISGAAGPAKLVTRNKDIDVANVSGRIDISNTHGDVKVTYANPPRENLSVTNDSGDAEVSLPASSNFQVSAVSKSGEVENDFESSSLKASNQNDRGEISGRVGSDGPTLNLTTTYGTIHLRKAS